MKALEFIDGGVTIKSGVPIPADAAFRTDEGREKTIAYKILRAHDKGGHLQRMRLKFDALVSHDITYV